MNRPGTPRRLAVAGALLRAILTTTLIGASAVLSPDAALCFYRIAQEALRNVMTHAAASMVDVRLCRIGESAALTITDDGKGFDVAAVHASGNGLGLVSIKERVRLAGGVLSIETALQKGTRLRAQIPVNAATPLDSGQAAAVALSGGVSRWVD